MYVAQMKTKLLNSIGRWVTYVRFLGSQTGGTSDK